MSFYAGKRPNLATLNTDCAKACQKKEQSFKQTIVSSFCEKKQHHFEANLRKWRFVFDADGLDGFSQHAQH